MGIRQGVEAINKRNTEVAKRANRSSIPELILSEDGDNAIFRILTDDPLDVDLHQIYDKTISNAPMFIYCTRDEEGVCELDEKFPGTLKRYFMFWIYVKRIVHSSQNDEKTWEPVTVGGRTMYAEDVGKIKLLRKTFGFGKQLWSQFEDMMSNYGTWKDRDYIFRRRGKRQDPQTSYTLTPLDKSPMPPEAIEAMKTLPSLEAVARGKVTRLDTEDKTAGTVAPAATPARPFSRPASVSVSTPPVVVSNTPTTAAVKPPKVRVEIPLPDVDDDEPEKDENG